VSDIHPGRPIRRPAAVLVVVIAQYLGGVLALGLAGFCVWWAADVDPNRPDPYDNLTPPDLEIAAMVIFSVFFAFFGVLSLTLGLMLQRGREWARITLIIINVLAALLVIVGASVVSEGHPGQLLALAILAAFLVLLNIRSTRRWTGARARVGTRTSSWRPG
jgi:hypothetical protein